MIDRATFQRMKRQWGGFGSWAVWADPTGSPTSNIGDMTVLDPDSNQELLRTLRKDVVMVGLNISRPFSEAFRNFHDSNPRAKDYKIRFAFKDTPYYGAYMTDIIKGVPMVKSTSILQYLKANPSVVHQSVYMFLAEVAELGSETPTILAFGADAHRLIEESVPRDSYSRLIKLMHYSHYVSKENYRRAIIDALGCRGHSSL